MTLHAAGALATCQICHGPNATVTTKALNGLPLGVIACDECRQAVRDRAVGVGLNADGSLHVTDGRNQQKRAAS